MSRPLLALVATAVLAVCAVAVASAVTHDDDSPTPEHTVRDFLLAAVSRHDGIDACRYVTRQALVDIHAVEPRGKSCEAAFSTSAHLELGGRSVVTEATVKGLSYEAEPESGGRVRVTVSSGGDSRSFVLRKATQRELVEYSTPPTPWRVDVGVVPLLTPVRR
jgi:hypothetical protein